MFPIVPIITGATSLLGGLLNSGSQKSANEQEREFTEQMYQKQRDDNRVNWNMQNEYNDPKNQMARLTAAGLNPNLVYGNGATTTAGSISGASPGSYKPQATRPGDALSGAMGAALQAQSIALTQDNMRAQNTVLKQEALLKEAQTKGQEILNNTNADPTYGSLSMRTADYRDRMAGAGLKESQMVNAGALNEFLNRTMDDRVNLVKKSLEQAGANLDRTKLTEKAVDLDNQFREYRNKLNAAGVNQNDPFYMRAISIWLSNHGINLNSL